MHRSNAAVLSMCAASLGSDLPVGRDRAPLLLTLIAEPPATTGLPMHNTPLIADFTMPLRSCLRMFVVDGEDGVVDLVEVDPRKEGAYAAYLGALDGYSSSRRVIIHTTFPFDPGRRTQRKALVKAVVAAARAAQAALPKRSQGAVEPSGNQSPHSSGVRHG